ncbi:MULTISPECIES: NAD(P)/FAD-dependent oxidoreductase [Sphingomonadaceae]|jgi:3-phenylpropionate/trans-cinnamate dioxygenase ferredoxin reductase component|uniref:FAD-dependent pyridine nucleotide-disulphide oxidoreductase n=4 Tax=Sphingomonadaceae TaxID=41297 RepID=A4XDS3_NOVAD|nr:MULTISPECIES: FAD-dependent oxidoreductase [Sphingomonadaceae]AAD03978.1 ferredoxin reductase subunit aromatic oxygenase [Novosphingobium aromaticivorans]ABP64084.1 FAD-dependent pyridine nucleotide-disulphide oxidoreductase [Novosphingobium aromaticivorans DSM 12444]AYO76042.1 pyridine nucleotide-disulfide oxidoreductase [Sphingobium yanoikuyae]KHS42355.1 FAD-dependent pyridine nucleotide-disulfide oxidoreductase [Novosphingobium subterraneum]QOV96695.1 FAD-dependent oxidoreductase [Novosp
MKSIAVVGANLAGGRAVESLRQAGFDGRITLIGEEPWRPYERPPLSKEVLWDPANVPDNFFLHDEAWYAANRIEMRLGTRAEALDLAASAVRLTGGDLVQADRILLTTGGSARKLNMEGADAANVHYLRTRDDATRMATDLRDGARIVIIGMGVIGAEVAASAVKLGCRVTAIEPLAAPMIRALGPQFGQWLGEEHRQRGVDTRFGRGVNAMKVLDGRVTQVELDDGSLVDCDAVVVGVGIVPEISLARDAGIVTNNGIIVDRQCRTSNENVFAAGDVAEQDSFFGGHIRQETYQNAADQAQAAALAMLGQDVDYCKPVWYWSDQFDLNIQFCGHIPVQAEVTLRGDMASNQFTAFFRSGETIEGILTVNRAPDMGIGKRLIERRARAQAAQLADADVSLREILKQAG